MDILFIIAVLLFLHFGHILWAVGTGMLFMSVLALVIMKETKKCAIVTTKVVIGELGRELAEIKSELELTRDELRRARRG